MHFIQDVLVLCFLRSIEFILLLGFFYVSCMAAKEGEYNICTKSKGGRYITIPNKVKCSINSAENVRIHQVGVFVPRSNPITSQAWKCTLLTRKICTNTGFFGSKGIIFDQTFSESVAATSCKEAVENSTYNGLVLKRTSEISFSTNLSFM